MANTLLISYDLHAPGQNYDSVIEEIKSLGDWAKVHKSFWFVDSTLSASKAAERLWGKMDSNDSLFVVDAKNNEACWYNLSDKVSNFLKEHWHK